DEAKQAAKKDVAKSRKNIAAEREREGQAITSARNEARRTIQEKFTTEQAAADRLRDFSIQETELRTQSEQEKTQTAYADAIWTADSLFEAAEKSANDQYDTLKRKAAAGQEAIDAYWAEALPLLFKVDLEREDLSTDQGPEPVELDDPLDRLEAAVVRAGESMERLREYRSLQRVGLMGYLRWLGIFAVIAAIPPFIFSHGFWWALGGIGFALGASVIAHAIARARVRRICLVLGSELSTNIEHAKQARELLLQKAKTDCRTAIQEATRERNTQKLKAQEKFPPLLARLAERSRSEIALANDKHERETERLRAWQYDSLQKVESHFGPLLHHCESRCDGMLQEAEDLYEERKVTALDERTKRWNALSDAWREGQDRLIDTINHLRAVELEYFQPWDAPIWKEFPPIESIPRGIRFGSITVDLHDLPGGVPTSNDLAPSIPIHMQLPAYLPFPDRCSMVLKARDEGRDAATKQLQKIMLRFLTAIPAGKVRFTVVDPVGLGDNFAAFMHMADFDENLIGARIWTEPAQIEKRLSDLTSHMENVIQKYLRNQFKNIMDYNASAGEVAEPFRVLVIANFPANFSLEAARRLVSIVQSGSTCGVYTIISVDSKIPPPQGFNMADIETGGITLTWKDNRFIWRDPDFERFPLTMKPPPAADEIVRLIRIIGERGRNANRVEVPFDSVIPKPEAIWTGDSRKGIAVPIGRSGATKLQIFHLGKGTAQHALVAGKTGSGKSTLLHALITNIALHYSPDEVELYLIDFKKGVEFKAYAESQLPHARVVAIESEREFGLSVLQRLDAELKQRGDRFRDAGVNDVAGYRGFMEKNPQDTSLRCPRIVLIVDEFQEFFVEDDRVAQETALLLDRLVRQGRAFGLHIVLGSQTLGGAYTLARSTIDQMAVRIALQCSDADAQLILNKDNTAARLLSRPGEAIYNDANGLVEGNDLFQVVYLPDTRREELLRQVHEISKKRGNYPPPLVFEGNTSADLGQNPLLAKLLAAPAWPADVRSASAWLGDAIAIKDPTAAVFRTQSGNHLLVIGQHEEAALALFASTLVSLAAQHDPKAQFTILDGTQDDDPNAGLLGRVAATLPHTVDFVERTQVGEQVGRLAALIAARQKGEQPERTARYLIVHGLQRYRELRKEEDAGFGRRGADRVISPAEHFANILRDGPAVGVHVLVWCDGLTNLNRSFDRPLLREFAMRVLFQMNANDSSTLIDNPLASRLGRNRALFISEEMPQAEKFRPYGLPTSECLKWVKQQLAKRAEGTTHAP
ncbi:MAG: cell division protein FtsK, partial [Planctomycetes bacterium]|nr:cell division protein FtsK [Planctomycetota bacterium]